MPRAMVRRRRLDPITKGVLNAAFKVIQGLFAVSANGDPGDYLWILDEQHVTWEDLVKDHPQAAVIAKRCEQLLGKTPEEFADRICEEIGYGTVAALDNYLHNRANDAARTVAKEALEQIREKFPQFIEWYGPRKLYLAMKRAAFYGIREAVGQLNIRKRATGEVYEDAVAEKIMDYLAEEGIGGDYALEQITNIMLPLVMKAAEEIIPKLWKRAATYAKKVVEQYVKPKVVG